MEQFKLAPPLIFEVHALLILLCIYLSDILNVVLFACNVNFCGIATFIESISLCSLISVTDVSRILRNANKTLKGKEI